MIASNTKVDVELIPKAKKLRSFLRETKFRDGKLVVKDIFAYLYSLNEANKIYEELKEREHYQDTVRYYESKVSFVKEILRKEYGILLHQGEWEINP